MTNAEIEQLNQLQAAGFRGVWAGELINKPATRELVRDGYADNGINGGGSPSALGRVFITDKGRSALHPTHIDALEKRVKELEAERDQARAKAIDECSQVISWCAKQGNFLLAAGEMTAAEQRSVKAVLGWTERRVRALNGGAKP